MTHNISYKILYFISFWAFFSQVQAQDIDIDGNFRDAEYYLFEKRYDKALPFYLKLYQADSTNYTVNYRIGECYFHILREQEKAIPYLEKASEKVSRRFVNEKYEQNIAHINTFLMLGELYQMKESLGKAFHNYKKYQGFLRSNEHEELEKVKQRIKSVYVAWELQQLYVPYSAIGLGDKINTRHSDYNPVLSANQDVMAYTSYWEATDVIFFTWKENGEWRKPYNITEMIGSQGDCYTSAIAPDGKTLYLVKQDFYDSDFYYSTYQDNKWLPMIKMSNRINSSDLETSLFISHDGKTMLFSSNRSGGKGNLDIYTSKATEKGDWSKPENIGSAINTSFDEEAPFLVNNGKLLFFSSKGHHSMGGYDIFFSEKKEDGSWSKPINMGYPINTAGDDLFYVPFGDGNTGYFVRDLPGGNGLMDIYKIEIPKQLLFQDKLADFDKKYESGYYEEVFAEYVDADEDETQDSNVVEMVHSKSVTSVNTERFVGSSGEISHVVKTVNSSQSSTNETNRARSDTLRPSVAKKEQASNTSSDIDFIRFDANAKPSGFTTAASTTTMAANPTMSSAGTTTVSSGSSGISQQSISEEKNHESKTNTQSTNQAFNDEAYHKQKTTREPEQTQQFSEGSEQVNDANQPSQPVSNEQYDETQTPSKKSSTKSVNNYYTNKADEKTVSQKRASNSTVTLYTVQIIALLNPVEASYFNQFANLTISVGHDGFTRYTIGEYQGYSAAEKALKRIQAKGFNKAFIRDVRTISNYKAQ